MGKPYPMKHYRNIGLFFRSVKHLYNYINSYLNLTYFYLDVSISNRDLRQKKLVQFWTEQASSDEDLW